MRKVDRDLGRIRELLRAVIRERGFTQVEVQDTAGWGRNYVSQLLNGQKSLRVEQLLVILKVIGVEPAAFYAEIFALDERPWRKLAVDAEPMETPVVKEEGAGSVASYRMEQRMDGLVNLLVNKKLMTVHELVDAIEKVERK